MRKDIQMPFGKYKGTKLSEVPLGYLLYLYDRKKLTGEIKKFAEENISILRFKKEIDIKKKEKNATKGQDNPN